MSGYYESESENEFEDNGSGKGLRKQLEQALGEIQSLRKELAGDRTKKAETTLKDMGLDPAVLSLAPEGTDPVEWVQKNATLLGAKGTEQKEHKIDEPSVEVATDDDPALVAEREALAAIQEAEQAGSNSVISSDLIEQMNKIDTEDELVSFFKRNGMA